MPAQQAHTLQLYTALKTVRPSWAGSLLLCIGLNETGRSLALASLAAGAASLFLEGDATQLRQAQREGCCTFSVTSLDEALRALKNEVRQKRAIAVALSGDCISWLSEAVERGFAPQAIAAARVLSEDELTPIRRLQGEGSSVLSGLGLCSITPQDFDLTLQGTWQGLQLLEARAVSLAERRSQDAALLEAVTGSGETAAVRRQWLRAAASLFPRDLHRVYWG